MASGTIDRNGLLAQFRTFLDADAVLHDAEQLKPYECDGLTAYRQTPLLVVLPETIEQVQQVLRVCAAAQVPVVARGAGTGLSGGALPLADGVLLVLAKFNRILSIDTANRSARVQARGTQPGDLRGGKRIRPLLCPGPVVSDRLQHRRQCRGECRWPALLEVRVDGAQYSRPRGAHHRR